MKKQLVFTKNYQMQEQSGHQERIFTGKVNDYYTVIRLNEQRYHRQLTMIFAMTLTEEEFRPLHDKLKGIKRIVDTIRHDHTIEVRVKPYYRVKKFAEQVNQVVEEVTHYAQSLNLVSGCFMTGETNEPIHLVLCEDTYMFVTEAAEASQRQLFDEAAQAPKKGNWFSATLGALFGALIGGVIWGVLLYFGYYVWWAAIIGILCSFHFYQKFGGKVNWKGAIVVIMSLIVVLALANRVAYSYVVIEGLGQLGVTDYDIVDVFVQLKEYLFSFDQLLYEMNEVPMYLEAYYTDNILGLGIGIVVGIVYFFYLYREAKRKGKITRIAE